MKMNKSEKEKIVLMVNNYRSIHDELNSYEKTLDRMTTNLEEKNEESIFSIRNGIKKCLDNLEFQRFEEKKFYDYLADKYGQGELDIATLEYKTKIF
jgi:hypothetical protein